MSSSGTASTGFESSRVSVVVPTFNRAAMLGECLESLVRQTIVPLEIIVVDDGSTDETPRVARSFGGPVRYLAKPNDGKPAALNFALPAVRGDWLWFLDDDDVALPRAIEARLEVLAAAPDAVIVFSRFLWGSSDSSGRIVPGSAVRWPDFTEKDFYPRFLRSCFVHLNGALVRRSRVEEVGGFRADLLTAEDYDFMLRTTRGAKVAICKEPSFIFRQHAGDRGPKHQRYSALERERKIADGDAEVGRWIRSTHQLGEFLGLPPGQPLDERARKEALLARLQVMASKGLPAEVAEDCLEVLSAFGNNGATLEGSAAQALKSGMQERYFAVRMPDQSDDFIRRMKPLARTAVGRSMLRAAARGLLGSAWWQAGKISQKARLASVAVRLMGSHAA